MSRALLRCFGERADMLAGQEEPLRLVSLRLAEEERAKFEAAVEVVAKLHQNAKAQKFLSENKTAIDLLDTEKTSALLDLASKVVILFAQILHEHFAAELLELRECCPKCYSMDVTIWAFNRLLGTYTCNLCGHKWTES